MEFLDELPGGRLAVMMIAGAGALLVPKLAANLPPSLRTALESGVKLFVEAESEAQGAFIERLVEQTLSAVLASVAQPGTDEERRHAAAAKIRHFEHRVRRRSARFGWSEEDRRARYRHHVRRLKRAIAAAAEQHPESAKPALAQVAGMIQEDW